MSEEIDRLWTLKGLDEQLVEARGALGKFPEQKRALEVRAAAEKQKLEELTVKIAAAQKKRRELEREVEVSGEQERKFASQLPAVKKNEEYQALLHEIAGCKKKRSDLETQVLVQMDAEEALASEKPGVEQALKEAQGALATRRSAIEDEERAAQGKVDAIEQLRAVELAGLPPGTRSRYERIHTSRGGMAVVAIVKGSCGGCFRGQPPQMLQESRKRDRLIVCDGCGRLLVAPPDGA